MIEIIYPSTDAQLQMARDLFRGFWDWSKTRYEAYLVEIFFDESYVAEMNALPGKLARPKGNLLLATESGSPAGCVGYWHVNDDLCEMTRMFVAPEFQRKGIGERLALQLLKESYEAGYKTMRLDTGSKQVEAQAMYRKIGFIEVPPPRGLPKEFEGMVISMEFPLSR